MRFGLSSEVQWILNSRFGGSPVQRALACLAFGVLLAAPAVFGQMTPSANQVPYYERPQHPGNLVQYQNPNRKGDIARFSRLGVSGGVSSMGINMQVATNAMKNLNIRGIGNYFSYNMSNVYINSSGGANGIAVSGNLNFATGGVAADYYPWSRLGFRVSPGFMFYNQNQISAKGTATAGSTITLGSQKYYADSVNPLNVSASLGLNTHQKAFMVTTGWGNLISRTGGHWSFPFEIGAVFTGVPALGMTVGGNACLTASDAASNGPTCVNMATNSTAQTNLAAQITKYKNDLNPYTVYPIVSFGVGYSFGIR